MPHKSSARSDRCAQIGIVVFHEANLIDVAGPAQVFRTAAEQLIAIGACDRPAYEIELLSSAGGNIMTSPGIALVTKSIRAVRPERYDTILVAGGHGAEHAAQDQSLATWLARAGEKARRIGSVCTGAFVLASSGALEGKRAATHWAYCDALQQRYPALTVERDAIFVEDQGVWSSAGVTSGMDLALAMVEADWGRELALLVARRLVIFVKRPGGQSQFSVQLRAQTVEGPLASLLQWMIENPDADLRAGRLAERAGMSLRNFFRAFSDATGQPPAEWIESMRLEHARRLLEQTEASAKEVALRSGFSSEERMRRAFQRQLGVSPADYRARFSRSLVCSEQPIALSASRRLRAE